MGCEIFTSTHPKILYLIKFFLQNSQREFESVDQILIPGRQIAEKKILQIRCLVIYDHQILAKKKLPQKSSMGDIQRHPMSAGLKNLFIRKAPPSKFPSQCCPFINKS